MLLSLPQIQILNIDTSVFKENKKSILLIFPPKLLFTFSLIVRTMHLCICEAE
jgi:hypothetical protein